MNLVADRPIYDPDRPASQVTVPLEAVVAVVAVVNMNEAGDAATTALVGREGFIGLPAVMSGKFLQAQGSFS